jgi:hypothetical protein
MPAVLKKDPMKSTLRILDMKLSLGFFCGRTMRTMPPATIARGEMNQNVARQVAFSVNAADIKGPMMLPKPTQDPRMP